MERKKNEQSKENNNNKRYRQNIFIFMQRIYTYCRDLRLQKK